MMSCSSIPSWKSRIAVVTLKEWLVLCPWIPAASHKRLTVLASVFSPVGVVLYQTLVLGSGIGVRMIL